MLLSWHEYTNKPYIEGAFDSHVVLTFRNGTRLGSPSQWGPRASEPCSLALLSTELSQKAIWLWIDSLARSESSMQGCHVIHMNFSVYMKIEPFADWNWSFWFFAIQWIDLHEMSLCIRSKVYLTKIQNFGFLRVWFTSAEWVDSESNHFLTK